MVRKAEHSGTSLAPSIKGRRFTVAFQVVPLSRDVCFVAIVWDLLLYLSAEQGAGVELGGNKKQELL